VQFHKPPQRPTQVEDTQKSPLDESSDPPPVKRLDGKITREGELPFGGGTHCEVWVGLWDKGGKQSGREKVDPEKVSLGFTTSALLTTPFAGGLEGTSSTQIIGERAQGLTSTDHFDAVYSWLLPRLLET